MTQNAIPISYYVVSLEIAPTDPAELPGDCPEGDELQAWIPYHGHCYYLEASSGRSWALASLECARLGESLLYQLKWFLPIFIQNWYKNFKTLIKKKKLEISFYLLSCPKVVTMKISWHEWLCAAFCPLKSAVFLCMSSPSAPGLWDIILGAAVQDHRLWVPPGHCLLQDAVERPTEQHYHCQKLLFVQTKKRRSLQWLLT